MVSPVIGANVLMGLLENLSYTNGFLDFRVTIFLFYFTIWQVISQNRIYHRQLPAL